MATGKYPTVQKILEMLWESPWSSPESREQVTMRILRSLSNLSPEQWTGIPTSIQKWYDKCYKQLIENKRLFYYPHADFVPVSPKDELGRYRPTSLFSRITELVLMDYTLTSHKIFYILQAEKRKTTIRTVEAAFYNIKSVLGIMQAHGLIDINKLYPKSEEAGNAQITSDRNS